MPGENLPKPSERLGIYLDLAKGGTGWCVAVGADEIIDHGVWEFPSKVKDGALLREFGHLLADLVEAYNPDVIVYENAMNQKARAGELFYAMAGMLKVVAFHAGLAVFQVSPTSLKRWGAGDAKATKLDVIKAVNKRHNLKIEDDNEADAVALVHTAWQLALYGELRSAK
jgi:Holliday junction resolvasome RuvABC endonuclease subunit